MIVEVKDLVKSFHSKPVLNKINLNVDEGEIFSLIGPNGAGKTTTLRCLYGELKPENGEIKLFSETLNPRIKEKISVMTEDRLTFSNFKGSDYLKIWQMLYPNFNEETFSNFVLHYNLDMNQKVERYSMGMKTLFYLALTISSNADLLLLDEPTQNLDPVIRAEALGILRRYANETNKTIVISSHEIYELEEISTSFAIIKEGKILYSDDMDSAKEKHRMIRKGEPIPNGEVVSNFEEEVLVRTKDEIGRFPTFNEIVLGYLRSTPSFTPFGVKKS
ncbi:multidrug ABC transporter ATPase [Petrotoga sp. 9PW.55.5.1]|jgi:ABC-2 type transport system ATP-binding protein|uniref:ABC transporter ATP-binding protein n=1 Tax=Petrotoga sp. 9PW.55.5.1 TaxID=1308979 RepID=UPI000DC250A4|nr:ABC transporter ATP-binding protein [Petrotoga sp. 9PW.55.5.1]RAO99438.1 multidrug ABC transporter ATPase [Petrotoga sp. 9PW.55.5.1]